MQQYIHINIEIVNENAGTSGIFFFVCICPHVHITMYGYIYLFLKTFASTPATAMHSTSNINAIELLFPVMELSSFYAKHFFLHNYIQHVIK